VIAASICVVVGGATPTSQSVQSTTEALQQAQMNLAEATKALADAQAVCLSKLYTSAEFKVAVADRDAKRAAHEAAEQGDNVQARLDAGSAYNLARQKVDQMASDAIKADGLSRSASAAMKRAQEQLSIAKQNDETYQQQVDAANALKREQDAKAQRDADAPAITRSALAASGKKLTGVRVKVSGEFIAADNSQVTLVPGVERPPQPGDYVMQPFDPNLMSGGGGEVPTFRSPIKDWVGIQLSDSDGMEFDEIFAKVAEHGNEVAALKRGQAVTIYGKVIELKDDQGYGVLVDEIVPTAARPRNRAMGN
jgi:hypothetical protein